MIETKTLRYTRAALGGRELRPAGSRAAGGGIRTVYGP